MGLDMYLYAERHVSGYSFYPEEEQRLYTGLIDSLGVREFVDPETPSAEARVCVAYWRKANAVHQWFVDNVQHGKDECQHAEVEREQLEELRSVCLAVLDRSRLEEGVVTVGWTYENGTRKWLSEPGQVVVNPEVAQERLPTQGGFFFGSTDYDQWYVADLRSTVEQIDRALGLGPEWTFIYHASW